MYRTIARWAAAATFTLPIQPQSQRNRTWRFQRRVEPMKGLIEDPKWCHTQGALCTVPCVRRQRAIESEWALALVKKPGTTS